MMQTLGVLLTVWEVLPKLCKIQSGKIRYNIQQYDTVGVVVDTGQARLTLSYTVNGANHEAVYDKRLHG